MTIETKHASLSTMAVTIQALHVSGKQMTLAVFRQLPIKNETEKHSGWGYVRYSIKDQGSIWYVYSEDGFLFRRELIPAWEKVTEWDLSRYEPSWHMKDDERAKLELKKVAYLKYVADDEIRGRADLRIMNNTVQLFISV